MSNPQSRVPLVSVVTVVYNGASTIENTVRSVVDQSFDSLEYIIIDGGSNDGTLDIIKKYEDRIAVLISEPDKGIYDAMNKGAAVASGEWVIFMNSGDAFATFNVLREFAAHSIIAQADVVFGEARIHYNTFSRVKKTVPLEDFWKEMPFSHQACFVRRALFSEQSFDTKYRLSSDFGFLYNLYRGKKSFVYVPVLVCDFDYTRGASVDNSARSIRERKEIVLSNEFSFKYWLYYTFFVQYVVWSGRLKRMLGKQFSEWLIRFFKR